jgi:ribonuclease P protein component
LLTLAPNPSGNLSPSRFSFSVSKKVCRNATDRNKFRRRGYAVTQKYVKNIKPGFLCVFSFKKGSAKMTFVEMEKEIVNLLSDASVIE